MIRIGAAVELIRMILSISNGILTYTHMPVTYSNCINEDDTINEEKEPLWTQKNSIVHGLNRVRWEFYNDKQMNW